ncbi:glutaminyl-peptide cyclotransferase [Prolixibacter denitrificans]|uniref:Glutamine cyclotransferase n=1 Tax=Prolixibacter denitrificans TaxID=1541063 RepID=A0A2P8CHD6_9BACT|nr:glutaminyl-peptide cyclotransferase [Prolixibacter denitrificans]PSK84381.1 glutamine cyclotransferase [Prolixibacter denitrificans]GET20556.1 glutamine cyclotransferase [Prolixibacter denitrificans]
MMKKLAVLTLTLSLTGILLFQCSSTPKRSRKPVTAIEILPKSKYYPQGTPITIKTRTNVKNGIIQNIKVEVDGKSYFSGKTLENEIKVSTDEMAMGKHSIKVIAIKTDSVTGENYSDFIVVSDTKPVDYTYKITATYPHNTKFFTEGLLIHNGYLYEGTGEKGQSVIAKQVLKTGKILQEKKLDKKYFGEGITILDNKLYQLTYKAQTGFIYDVKTFDKTGQWHYEAKEGWGMTNDGTNLIMSDGTENLRFLNPDNQQVLKTISVYDDKGPVKYLNELEYINGEIWANVWTTNTIVRINPNNGKVLGRIDLTGLLSVMYRDENKPIDVLNGIAWNAKTNAIYVTGKLWPKLFEIVPVKK